MEENDTERIVSCRESLKCHREELQARLDSEKENVEDLNFYESRYRYLLQKHIDIEVKAANKVIGKKDDAGKQRWYAMPLCVLKDLADVFNAGKVKYGIFNCLQEFDNHKERFWDALMRHLEECQIDPLSKDPETGCYHAACVAFNALMYLYHCKRGAK